MGCDRPFAPDEAGMGQAHWSGREPGGSPGGAPLPWPSLAGLKVLVVEDEILVAMTIEDMLTDFGCATVGHAANISQALSAIDQTAQIDVAVLDVNLAGEKIYPVSDALYARGVPFVFSTGFGPADLMHRYPACRLVNKPYRPDALAQALVALAGPRAA
jgi:CheY-like chemotaxis protein